MNTPPRHQDTETTGPADQPRINADPELDRINVVTEKVIGLAIEVHRVLGPGLLEQTYVAAFRIELEENGVAYAHELRVPAYYKGRILGEYRIDYIVENCVVVEIKSVERVLPVSEAQMLTYLRVTRKRVGLLMNFNSRLLTSGVHRYAL